MNTHYTVNQLARLAGISRRTLHHYDAIGLLAPAATGDNGYRYYDEASALALQQILCYRQLGFSLEQIKTLLHRPDFDLLAALEGHKRALGQQVERLDQLIHTVEQTILHLKGEIEMSTKDFYTGFDEEQQKRYEEEASQRWGAESVAESSPRWNANTPAQKNAILAEGNEISLGIAGSMELGFDHPTVQYWIRRWHQSIDTNFYPCSLEIFEALGHGYVSDPRFTAFYEKVRPGLAAFMERAMVYYCAQQRG
jgi:DNA-binding transcriptional MerR regulator